MITVTVYRKDGSYIGYQGSGHAEYAESGEDILCAAASVLLTNTANSIEALCGDVIEAEEEDGFLSCSFPDGLSEGGNLLIESMILGIRQISEIRSVESDEPFLELNIEEVKSC